MAGVGWIMTIVLGALAGWIAEKIMKSDMGILMNIVLGVAGALILNAILAAVGIGFGGIIGQLLVAIVGACLLIFVGRLIKGRGRA